MWFLSNTAGLGISLTDRYVEANNGFQVLYEMLEDEHPAMCKDPIQQPPNSSECQDDIMEYSARFTSYLVSKNLNSRTYHAREQVILFHKGLDSKEFAPAVQYIETLMDSWGQTGLNPKWDMLSPSHNRIYYEDSQQDNAHYATHETSYQDDTNYAHYETSRPEYRRFYGNDSSSKSTKYRKKNKIRNNWWPPKVSWCILWCMWKARSLLAWLWFFGNNHQQSEIPR